MERFQLAFVMMQITDSHWGPRDAHSGRREFTADELDALANFGWHAPDLTGVMVAGAHAAHPGWRPRASEHLDLTPLPSAAAPSQG